MKLTNHARVRMQQRAISRQALERDVGRRMLQRNEKALNAYMVCAEGQIATVGHRYQRIVRH